jgi:hypothetical protein
MAGTRRASTNAAVAAIVVAVLLLLAACWTLRQRGPTYSAGDQALLEIYTLHAARHALAVGPYSRFFWNHPGPSLFYSFVPGYLLSGDRQDGLFVTTLFTNIAAIAVAVLYLRRFDGGSFAAAFVWWLVVLFVIHPLVGGRDLGDLLSSSWNPHAPMLPLALLVVLAAALATGSRAVIPGTIAVASFVTQAHVGLVPVSTTIVGASLALCMLARSAVSSARDVSRVPIWAVILDAVAGLYLLLLAWITLLGGFDVRVFGHTVRVNSADRLLMFAVIILALRHAGARQHPRLSGLLNVVRQSALVKLMARQPTDRSRSMISSGVVLLGFWGLTVGSEVIHFGHGNLVQLVRFMGEFRAPQLRDGFAAVAHYLAGPLLPALEMAVGGRVVTSAWAAPGVVAIATTELLLVGIVVCRAVRNGQAFRAAFGLICLLASASACWSAARIHGDLHDHLTFWIVILGVMNLTLVTTVALDWVMAHGGFDRVITPAAFAALTWGGVLGLTVVGTVHLAQRDQRGQVSSEIDAVRQFVAATRTDPEARRAWTEPVRIDMGSDAWSVGAGVLLELYKARAPVTVVERWSAIFGPPLKPNAGAQLDLIVADEDMRRELTSDRSIREVARSGRLTLLMRRAGR